MKGIDSIKSVNQETAWVAAKCLDLKGDFPNTPRKLPMDFTFKVKFLDIQVKSINFHFKHVPSANIELSREDDQGISEVKEIILDRAFFEAIDIYDA